MKTMRYFYQHTHTLALAMIFTLIMGIAYQNAEAEAWPPELGEKNIVYLVGPWDTGASISYLGKILLEQMGYNIDIKRLDTGLAYQALATGSGDIWSSGYLPGQHSYVLKHKDKMNLLSMSYMPVYSGFIVPDYMPISHIDDLKKPEIKKLLGGRIIGLDAGSGVMMAAEKAVKAYGIDYEVIAGSSPAMEASFQAAYLKQDPIVVIGWCPTAMCAKFGVKLLEEPKGIMASSQDFHVVRSGFRSDFPRAAALLSRLTLHENQISEMVLMTREKGSTPEKAAQQFIDQNPELIWFWAGDLIPNLPMPDSIK